MKVIILNHRETLSQRVIQEMETLREKGIKVKVLKLHRNRKSPEKSVKDDILTQGLNILKIIFYLPCFYHKARQILSRESLEIVHCTHLLLLPLAIRLSNIKNAKIVYDAYEIHALNFSNYIPLFSPILRKAVEFIENRFITKVHCILTVDSIGDFLSKRYRKFNNNVVVLYNVPDEEPHPNRSRFLVLQQKYQGAKLLIYVGGIYKQKGLMKLFEVVALVKKKFPEIMLLFIGVMPKSIGLKYITKYNLNNNINIINWLPYEEMYPYLKIACIGLALQQPTDLFLLVSKGNGRKFFTYMQASLPIVGPNFGEIGQVVREEKCGILVDTTDAKQIAKAIIYLLEHPSKAKVMGNRGKRAILKKYNWSIEKRKFLAAYARILS